MRAIDVTGVTWRKSSYSNPDGGNCVEASDDLLGSASWRTSSYSNTSGGECVEVAPNLPAVVPVRDSKDPARGVLLIEAGAWSAFVGGL